MWTPRTAKSCDGSTRSPTHVFMPRPAFTRAFDCLPIKHSSQRCRSAQLKTHRDLACERVAIRVAAASAIGVRGIVGERSMTLQQQRIHALCEELKLPDFSAEWSALAQRAADTQASFADFLTSLLETEQAARTERIRQTLLNWRRCRRSRRSRATTSALPPAHRSSRSKNSPH